MTRRVFKEPLQKINERAITLDILVKSIQNSIQNKLHKSKTSAVEIITKLDALSPLKTLARGYNIAEKNGKIITKKQDVNLGDEITLRFIDGNVVTKVIDK